MCRETGGVPRTGNTETISRTAMRLDLSFRTARSRYIPRALDLLGVQFGVLRQRDDIGTRRDMEDYSTDDHAS